VSPLDLAFIVGPLGAPIIGILVMVALTIARPTKWALWIGTPLFGLVGVTWLTYWFLWGRAFDRVDAELGPVASSEVAMNTATWACAAGCIALAVTALSAFRSARRLRTDGR
jgi:hypothetical protein